MKKTMKVGHTELMRSIVKREINVNKPLSSSHAAPRMSAPREYSRVDRSAFVNNSGDKAIKKQIKKDHEKELKKVYGVDWKKHLNTPAKQIGKVKITF